MIKFEGELSENCRKYVQKRETLVVSMVCWIVSLIACGFIVLLSLKTDLIVLLFLVPILALAIMGSIPQKKIVNRIPKLIEIGDEYVSMKSETGSYSWSFQDIKGIVDMGDWFVFKFYFPHKNLYVVCEKNLLTQGSLDEFHSLLKDKIKL